MEVELDIFNLAFIISTLTTCSENTVGCFILTANPSWEAELLFSLLACIDITTHSIFMKTILFVPF